MKKKCFDTVYIEVEVTKSYKTTYYYKLTIEGKQKIVYIWREWI